MNQKFAGVDTVPVQYVAQFNLYIISVLKSRIINGNINRTKICAIQIIDAQVQFLPKFIIKTNEYNVFQ